MDDPDKINELIEELAKPSKRLSTEDQVAEFKQSIKTSEYDLFITDHIIDQNGFVDFTFLGTHNNEEIIWNACITTSFGDYYDAVHSPCLDEANEKYPSKHKLFCDESFKPIPGTDLIEWIDLDPDQSFKRYRYTSELTMKILAEESIKIVGWNIEIDEDYQYGVGLHIRIDKDWITVDDVNDVINRVTKDGVEAFKDKDHTPKSIPLDVLDLELLDDSAFIHWKRGSKDTVALNIGIDDDDDD